MPKKGEYIRSGNCSSCEEEVEVVAADFGIGSYEYWGAKGTHHDWREVCGQCGEEADDE